ncbi:hypothetical protein QQ045_003370 [Rhodiola kirilowii]
MSFSDGVLQDAEDLKQKLQSTRMELEAARLEVSAAKKQTREKERELYKLLQMACKERDEAREQLQNVLSKINPMPEIVQPSLMMIHNNNILTNSEESNLFTESNTLSDAFNSYVSSPVDSLFDAVTSPEFSTLNNIRDFVHDMGQNQKAHPTVMSMFDQATVVIDELAKGKVLPQQGKLLEAVREAGPLLQTLMLAAPLPRWRIPPPPLQPFKIPQIAPITGSTCTPFAEMSCGSSSHMATNSMLNFSYGGGSSLQQVSPAMMMINMNMNNQIAVGKRQRLM